VEPKRIFLECLARRTLGGDAVKHLVMACLLLFGCRNESKSNSSPTAASAAPSASVAAPSPESIVALDCLPCHDNLMLEQHRLTAKQWGAVVKKMQKWGSLIPPENVDSVVAYLAKRYPADGPDYTIPSVPVAEVAARFGSSPDGPFASGDVRRGESLFKESCATCHGIDAKGAIGTALANRLILQHPAEFAATIRKGRGRMPGTPAMPDGDIAALLAHLRAQKPQ
jgi:cytochrome c553